MLKEFYQLALNTLKASTEESMARIACGWSRPQMGPPAGGGGASRKPCPLHFSMRSRRRLGWCLYVGGNR